MGRLHFTVSVECLASFSAMIHVESGSEWGRDMGKTKEIRTI